MFLTTSRNSKMEKKRRKEERSFSEFSGEVVWPRGMGLTLAVTLSCDGR
jgi:hypothetical protein